MSNSESAVPLLDIKNAMLWRGTTRVFKNLSLTIDQGECVAILGANGAGKTTLLKAINREVYPVKAAGSYLRILGRERWNVWQLRRHIGIVSNDLHLQFPAESRVIDAVVSGFHSSIGVHGNIDAQLTAEEYQHAHDSLCEIGLADRTHSRLGELSTGQQRRVLLARALVHNPATLILDEPTAGLDLAASFSHMARIAALANQHRNIILVTHKIGEIPPPVTRVILLKSGEIVADGEKNRILTSEVLSQAYDTPVRIVAADGYYLPYPGHSN